MIYFLLSASVCFSLFLVSCLVPCVGKLQAKPERKMLAVGWWHRFAKKSQSNIYRRLHFRLQFNSLSTTNKNENNLLQCREIREGKLHCVSRWKVTRWDGSGGRCCSSQDGERLEDEMEAECDFYELGSECSDPSHCENSVETKPPWNRHELSIISEYWEISFLQTESGETSARSRGAWTRINKLKPSFHWHIPSCSAQQGGMDIQVMKASKMCKCENVHVLIVYYLLKCCYSQPPGQVSCSYHITHFP